MPSRKGTAFQKFFCEEQITTFDLASSTRWSTGTDEVDEWGVSLSPWGAALLYLHLLPKLIIVVAEADHFFLLGIILKNSSPYELVGGFLPAMSVA